MKFFLFFTVAVFLAAGCATVSETKKQDNSNLALLEANTPESDFPKYRNMLLDGKFAEAAQYFEKSKEKEAPFYLALAYYNLGKAAEAEPLFQKSITAGVRLDESYYNLGLIAYENKNEDNASGFMSKALESNENHAGANFFLGGYWYKKGDFNKAESFYTKATAADPKNTDGWNALFYCYINKKDFQKAWELRDKIDASEPQTALNIILCGEKLEKYQEALNIIDKQKIVPKEAEFQRLILMSKMGNIHGAFVAAKKMIPTIDAAKEFIIIDRGRSGDTQYAVFVKKDLAAYLKCGGIDTDIRLKIEEGMTELPDKKKNFSKYSDFIKGLSDICR